MHRYVRRYERDSKKHNLLRLFLDSYWSTATLADLRIRRKIFACSMSNIASCEVAPNRCRTPNGRSVNESCSRLVGMGGIGG